MLLVASTGPVLVRCCQHRPSTGPVLAHNGMFMGMSGVLNGPSLVQTQRGFGIKDLRISVAFKQIYLHRPNACDIRGLIFFLFNQDQMGLNPAILQLHA